MTSLSNRLFTTHKSWSVSVMPCGMYSLDIRGAEQPNTGIPAGEIE